MAVTAVTIKNLARILAGALVIVQAAVNANNSFSDPWRWIVPMVFAVGLYILGEISGAAPALLKAFRMLKSAPH